MQANSYDAQFGRTSGGVVNVITKSGTNALHGVAYDFERHSVMDANNFFNNRSGRDLSSFQRHQFGGNLGAAVLKNKWFFFGDYEGLRQGYRRPPSRLFPRPCNARATSPKPIPATAVRLRYTIRIAS